MDCMFLVLYMYPIVPIITYLFSQFVYIVLFMFTLGNSIAEWLSNVFDDIAFIAVVGVPEQSSVLLAIVK